MKMIAMLQNSDEWEQLRNGKIGASDANIIMGVSKFMTPRELWRKKKGLLVEDPDEVENTFVTDKGHRMEEKARALYELQTMEEWPPVVAVHAVYAWFMASLDGFCAALHANWECKYVGQDDFDQVFHGHMLAKYYPQVQSQMIVTGAKLCHFTVITEDKSDNANPDFPFKMATIIVEFDLDYCKNTLFPKLVEFQAFIDDNVEPPISERDYLEEEDPEFFEMLQDYKIVKKLFDMAEKNLADFKERIIAKMNHPRVINRGVKLLTVVRESKMIVDFEQIVKDNNLEIDSKYTKMTEESKSIRVTFPAKTPEQIAEEKMAKEKLKADKLAAKEKEKEEKANAKAEAKAAKEAEKAAEKERKAQEKADQKSKKLLEKSAKKNLTEETVH